MPGVLSGKVYVNPSLPGHPSKILELPQNIDE